MSNSESENNNEENVIEVDNVEQIKRFEPKDAMKKELRSLTSQAVRKRKEMREMRSRLNWQTTEKFPRLTEIWILWIGGEQTMPSTSTSQG